MSGLSTRLLSGLLHIQRTELGTRAAAENVSQFVYDLAEGSLGRKQSSNGVACVCARVCVAFRGVLLLLFPHPSPFAVACISAQNECLFFLFFADPFAIQIATDCTRIAFGFCCLLLCPLHPKCARSRSAVNKN